MKRRKTLANRVVATLSSLYGWAEGKLVPRGFNPCATIERYKEEPRERYLADIELKRLGKVLTEMRG